MKERILEQVSKFLDQERFGSITITKSKYGISIELGSIQTEWSRPPEDIDMIKTIDMKRTIKFRGKRTDNGEWAYGGYSMGFIMTSMIYLS